MVNKGMKQNIKLQFEAPACALERWNPVLAAKKSDTENTINIYSTIGEYGDGHGTTPKQVTEVLAAAKGKEVTLNINSPGGDFHEGVAIYNLLNNYEGTVVVNVLGLAASAASLVALAGDEVNIGTGASIMIHRAWTVSVGDTDSMAETKRMLDAFDKDMVKIYASKIDKSHDEIYSMMKETTWMDAESAIDMGFAHALLGEDKVTVDACLEEGYNPALKEVDIALARAGMPRSKRKSLLKEIKSSKPCAAEEAKPSAGEAYVEALQKLHAALTN